MLIKGDARYLPLKDVCVDCVVTSPPYFGLRDYGTVGQIGLEPTPDAYVAALVAVFRDVRRVLKPEGVAWLNLGSSYMASGERQTGRNDNGRPEKGRGWAEYDIKRTRIAAAGASGRIQSLQPERALAYDSDGTALPDSTVPDFACSDLCDGCRSALVSLGSVRSDQPTARGALPPSQTGRDTELVDCAATFPAVSLLDAPASTMPRSSGPRPAECSHCANCGACLSVLRSASRDSRLCAHSSAYSGGTTEKWPPSADRTSGREPSGLAWEYYTSTIKPKDMVQTPWMVAMALQADGWYLRSDIIWSKPNPMPESVTDRPTKAHEYLFLLTKSERYYYDADAIKEPSTWQRANNPEWAKQRAETNAKKGCGNRNAQSAGFTEWDAKNGRNKRSVWTVPYEGQATKDYDSAGAQNPSDTKRRVLESMADPDYAGANKKSVWTVNTMPYSGAHFATMPEKLVEPCILAGCPMGGLVCDPFVGSGTVVSVAQRLGRRGVGVDLSYQDLARKRTAQRGLMFALPDGGGLSQP